MQRRKFLAAAATLPAAVIGSTTSCAATGATTSAPATAPLATSPPPADRNFKISLKADAIGVNMDLMEMLDRAAEIGYEALSVPSWAIGDWDMAKKERFAASAKAKNISWGANGLPVDWRQGQDKFKKDMAGLAKQMKDLANLGVDRIGTWILPQHDELTYMQNFELHRDSLREAAEVCAANGIRLGLEYVGTTTLRNSGRYTFLSSSAELKDLIDAIDVEGVGVILDSFHWWGSGESADDLDIWTNQDIVAVDLNDANSQLGRTEQQDLARELPGATGAIPVGDFIRKLAELNYDGPVRAEPFSATLNAMPDDLAMQATYFAVKGAIDKALAEN